MKKLEVHPYVRSSESLQESACCAKKTAQISIFCTKLKLSFNSTFYELLKCSDIFPIIWVLESCIYIFFTNKPRPQKKLAVSPGLSPQGLGNFSFHSFSWSPSSEDHRIQLSAPKVIIAVSSKRLRYPCANNTFSVISQNSPGVTLISVFSGDSIFHTFPASFPIYFKKYTWRLPSRKGWTSGRLKILESFVILTPTSSCHSLPPDSVPLQCHTCQAWKHQTNVLPQDDRLPAVGARLLSFVSEQCLELLWPRS